MTYSLIDFYLSFELTTYIGQTMGNNIPISHDKSADGNTIKQAADTSIAANQRPRLTFYSSIIFIAKRI